jgi:hypothetical protein
VPHLRYLLFGGAIIVKDRSRPALEPKLAEVPHGTEVLPIDSRLNLTRPFRLVSRFL